DDAAHIRSEQWWSARNGTFNVMHVSYDDAASWIPITLNEDDVVSMHYGPVQFGERVIFPSDGGSGITTAYVTPAVPPSGSVSVSVIPAPSQVDHWRWFDGLGTASRRNALPS